MRATSPDARAFRKRLLDWYAQSQRALPWRETRDPYAIWISEIMLQQTRVATVLPYYRRWLERFPTVEALAGAREEDVLLLWSGLGYYSRARNIHAVAKQLHGPFPSDYESIRALRGVGDYTASAISSIAFDIPRAAVDGNMFRVLSRVLNDSGDIGSASTKQRLTAAAQQLLDRKQPGSFNQAMMELGATVCLPKNPHCLVCPVSSLCKARQLGKQGELPVKLRRAESVRIDRTLLIIRRRLDLLFWQRSGHAQKLAGFWELPEPEQLPGVSIGNLLGNFRHSITNHLYRFSVCEASVVSVNSPSQVLRWINPSQVEYLFSTTARKALRIARVPGF